MTTTSFKMGRRLIASYLLPFTFLLILFTSCVKSDSPINNTFHPFSYSSDVLDKWMTLQQRLMRNATGIPNHAFARHFAYSGVAALESMRPGLPGQAKWSNKWNGLTGLPAAGHMRTYYFPANVNAAMAAINKAVFPNANVADKAAIDSLEAALYQSFLTTEEASVLVHSSNFG